MSVSPHAIEEDIAIVDSSCLGVVGRSDSCLVNFRSASQLPVLSARHGSNDRDENDGDSESDSGRRRYSFDFLDDEDAAGEKQRLFNVDADEVLSEIPAEKGVPSHLIDPCQRCRCTDVSSNERHRTKSANSRSAGRDVLANSFRSELDSPERLTRCLLGSEHICVARPAFLLRALRTLRAHSTTRVRLRAASQDRLPQEFEEAEPSSTTARAALSQNSMAPSSIAHDLNVESIADYIDPHENLFQMTPERQEAIVFDSPTRVPTSESGCFGFTDSDRRESSEDEVGDDDDGDIVFSDFHDCDFKYNHDVDDPCNAATSCNGGWPAYGSTSTSRADDLLELHVLPVAPGKTRPLGLPSRPGRRTSP